MASVASSEHQLTDKTDLQTGFHLIDYSVDWRQVLNTNYLH